MKLENWFFNTWLITMKVHKNAIKEIEDKNNELKKSSFPISLIHNLLNNVPKFTFPLVSKFLETTYSIQISTEICENSKKFSKSGNDYNYIHLRFI